MAQPSHKKYFPTPVRLDLMICYLWTCGRDDVPQGVFSHDTAFSLFPYSVWLPTEKHITVPRNFRRRGAPPEPTRLYKRDSDNLDVTMLEGVTVTKPVRTIVDLLASGFVQRHHLRDFMRVALETGFVTRVDMIGAHLDAQERKLFVDLLDTISYERIEDIRIGASIPASA